MAARRSARLQNQEALTAVEVQQRTAVGVARNNKKHKTPADHAEGSTGPKKRATKLAIRKSKMPPSQAHSSSASDALMSLPVEILDMIIDNIGDISTIRKLGRTCKRYYAFTMPRIHKRIAVDAMYYQHIPRLIRALEPHLTINRRRQLKLEGHYKGQQERYSSRLDADAKPACASYVRQMVVGAAKPGRKHEYIVHRYVEEALKNMINLEIVEAYFLTESMGESIASLKNLQALRLSGMPKAGAMTPLAKIKTLRHLSIDCGVAANENNVVQSMLLNSASTLRSLVVKMNSYRTNFLHDWEKKISADDTLAKQKHSLTALKSLTLDLISLDPTFIESLQRAIDFMGLHELTIGRLSNGDRLFFQHLTSLIISSRNRASGISLRCLCLDMSDGSYWHHAQTPETARPNLDPKCRFISAFDTLTTLEIKAYNPYPGTIATNLGPSDSLLRGILKHKNLRNLKISYTGSSSKVLHLSAAAVAAIIDNLPQLQIVEFPAQESEPNEIGKALSRGTNLTSITCLPLYAWGDALGIIVGILQSFLSRDDGRGSGEFVWEDHFKLKRVSVNNVTCEVASKFGNPKNGAEEATKLRSEGYGTREVLYRFPPRASPMYGSCGYDYRFAWVEKVAKDIA